MGNLPNGVLASDTQYAKVTLNDSANANGKISTSLYVSGYNFNIPSTAFIQGIKVDVQRFYVTIDNASVKDSSVMLLKAGNPVGQNYASSVSWPTSNGNRTYGSAADLWGTSWTPADINNSAFGVDLKAVRIGPAGTTANAFVDFVKVTVYYSLSNPPTATITSPSGMTISKGSFADPHNNNITVSGSLL